MGRHYTRLHRTTWYVYNSCDYKCSGDPFHRPAKTQLSCRTHLFRNLPLSSRLLGDRDASYVNNFQNAVTQQCLDRQSSPLTCRYVAQPIYLHRSQSSIAVLWVQDQKLSRHRETARFCVHSIFYVSVSLDWPKAECSRPVRPSVRPSVRSFFCYRPCACCMLKTNVPILLQIGTSGPRCKQMKSSTFGVGGQRSRSHHAGVRFGDLAMASLLTPCAAGEQVFWYCVNSE